ncbi:MAG: SDR family NAD(P)-dependent oxidoreductase, partial [Planctomycetes bacterium]|nr:SDR family NAD(P)-dependent oxidoreductase [Planctomycetota bacterium]
RLFLQEGYKAFEDAGYSNDTLSNKKCGVYLGIMSNEYSLLLSQRKLVSTDTTGNSYAIAAARIAYYLNLKGPAIPVDTACSSSLVAIHLACQALLNHEIEMALAGGVSLYLTPESYLGMCQAGMLSPEGQCKTFDDSANGFVPGEGVGAVVLKRLKDAERDNDSIYGVILGSGINQDGKTNGITAPSVNSQIELERDIYSKYKIDPEAISYVETHGTGTKLGDPIELEALSTVFQEKTSKRNYCALASVKSNIGHTSGAAGVASVHKVLLSMKHQKLVPSLHCTKENAHFDFKNSPFYVNTETKVWEKTVNSLRCACVSSFGYSGTNAHLVLEEYPSSGKQKEPISVVSQNLIFIIPLSAKNRDCLYEIVKELQGFLSENQQISLNSLAYTLQVGREAMEERLGFIVTSIKELEEKLEAYLAGNKEIEDSYQGQVKRDRDTLALFTANEELQEAIEKWIQRRKLSSILDLWVKGLVLDWNKLYGDNKPKRISLPTYPFARERYWIIEEIGIVNKSEGLEYRQINPLLHQNTSTLEEERFTSAFTGEEFFLNDHQLKGEKVLPGVGYLEMARAAVEKATGEREAGTAVCLKNVVWAQPIVVDGSAQKVHIGLYGEESGQIQYEVYTESDNEDEAIVHSQGTAQFKEKEETTPLDIENLQSQMNQGTLSAESCYEAFKEMGIEYGEGHRGIRKIYQGEGQVLARLSLPPSVQDTQSEYVLHPSLMDSALQSSIGLMLNNGVLAKGSETPPGIGRWPSSIDRWTLRPSLPFALESLEILAPCTKEMHAWVCHSSGSVAPDKVQKLDIDLCDEQGNVCVKMRGFAARVLGGEIGASKAKDSIGTLLATPVWKETVKLSSATRQPYAEHQVLLCEIPGVKASELQSLVPGSNCINLKSNQDQIESRFTEYAVRCFEMFRKILEKKPQGKVLVQILVPSTQEQSLFVGLSGLLKTAALENPKIVGQIIQVDPREKREELARKLEEDQNTPYDAIIRYEGGTRCVLAWEELKEMEVRPEVAFINKGAFKDRGVYLITGGLGGLGVLFAREILSESKDAKIILTGRSELTSQRQSVLKDLQALGGEVDYHQVDVSDLEQVNSLVESIEGRYGKLDGIIHSAGVILDNFILKKSEKEFRQVLLPKVAGTVNLDKATRGIALDFFILFSSGAGAMGNIGQADYATANAFLDRFAAYRSQLVDSNDRKGQTLSINWPLWREGGMGVDVASEAMMKQSTGMIAMKTETGIQAFYQSLNSHQSQSLVMEGNLLQMRTVLLETEQIQEEQVDEEIIASSVDPKTLEEKTGQYLKKQFSSVLKLPSYKIDVE